MTRKEMNERAPERNGREQSPPPARKFSDIVERMYARGQLSGAGRRAARDLVQTVEALMTEGQRGPSPIAVPRGRGRGEREAIAGRLLDDRNRFNDWVDGLDAAGIPAGAVLDILIDGDGTGVVDRRYRRRHGWARDQLVAALNLWPMRSLP